MVSPIAPPGELTADAVRCPQCAYRNVPAWKKCYACGSPLDVKKAVVSGPPVKRITSFEDKHPFSGGAVVEKHASDGKKALRIDKSYVVMDGPQDWSSYDYLKADLHVETGIALRADGAQPADPLPPARHPGRSSCRTSK